MISVFIECRKHHCGIIYDSSSLIGNFFFFNLSCQFFLNFPPIFPQFFLNLSCCLLIVLLAARSCVHLCVRLHTFQCKNHGHVKFLPLTLKGGPPSSPCPRHLVYQHYDRQLIRGFFPRCSFTYHSPFLMISGHIRVSPIKNK